jgi:hypothetical protein
MGRMLLALGILIVLSIPSNVFAIPPDAPSFLSSTLWHGPNSVRVLDNRAYVAYPSGFAVFDVADPANPLLLGRTYAYGGNQRVEVSWPYAFVGAECGIRIIDIRDPKHPTEVGFYQTNGELIDFAFARNLGYVECASAAGRLEVVDFGIPTAPVLLGSCPAYGFNVALAGNYVYLPAYHDGVAVVDISQPEHPHLIGRWSLGVFVGLRVHGNRAYCLWASGEKKQEAAAKGLRDESGVIVYDLSNPVQPTYLGEYQGTEWARDIFFDGGLAYLASGSGTATILDFSEPANPVVVGHLITEGNSADLDFANHVAYLADGWTGLVTVDVSDPVEPQVLGSYWEAGGLYGLAVDGRAGYIADGTFGLHVVDIRNPLGPEEISRLSITAHPQEIAVSGDFVYLGQRDAGFDVVDVADLQHPELVAHLDVPVSGLAIAGGLAYVVKDDRFTSIDIHDPSSPIVLGGCAVPLWAWDVCVQGDFAYVGNSYAGLVVVDISNPARPVVRGSVDTFDWMFDVVTNGSFVYADLGHNRLGVYDVTNPDAPRSVVELQLPGWLNGLQLAGDRLFAAADPGVRVYDVSTPDNPVEVGTGEGSGGSIAIRDSFVYLAGGGSFLILGPTLSAIDTATAATEPDLRIFVSNPVSDEAKVRIRLAREGLLSVDVYDIGGRRLATLHDGPAVAGEHQMRWFGAEAAPAGVYYVRAAFEGRSTARPLLKIR